MIPRLTDDKSGAVFCAQRDRQLDEQLAKSTAAACPPILKITGATTSGGVLDHR
jgi:hypothetical protein